MRKVIALCISLMATQAVFAADPPPPVAEPGVVAAESTPDANDPLFQEKLKRMLERTNKSLGLIRTQITQNQSAPFLANLYMQLGDLLAQKSNVLYYLQMEHDKNTDTKVNENKRFSPVVVAQQEAIAIYQQIIKEFPKFDQLDKVMYRLAVSQKAIDEAAAFVDTSEKLIKAYPDSKEAIQARLLLGQHFYDAQDYTQALIYLNAVKDSPQPYERSAARYRIGLIEILQEKHAAALKHFEQVATDDELKDDANPLSVNLKTKDTKNNIKREAMIDSVRAYTEVYKINPDPVAYYSRIAPTEVLFQEAIEKLAYRYIFLKQYNSAIKLLRTLSERTADAQKIMNIYHEVLQMIPIADRINLPAEEIHFVLDKYNYWSTHYSLTPELKKKSFEFFETQVRELATRSHDLAKREKESKRRADLYERARKFYLLYLSFFNRDRRSVKIATNLADVYFNQSNYLESASYYMRVYNGEFGASTQKEDLIQNAILALQKPSEYAFYEQLRSKGLLVKAIQTYQSFNPKKKNDPGLNFTLAKTYYEQGFYDTALGDLYNFMKSYPEAREVDSAAELILNYFNTRSDFKGIVDWTNKMLALKPRSAALRQRLASVRSKALLKRLDERVKTQKGYDEFSQGKSYLQTALTSGDASLRSAAFEQALGRSKAERDIETFLKTAFAMAKAESKPKKRADLLSSMADETLAITRFYLTQKIWRRVLNDPAVSNATKAAVYENLVKMATMLHDLPQLASLLSSGYVKGLKDTTVKNYRQLLAAAVEAPISTPPKIIQLFASGVESEDEWLTLFKAQDKMPIHIRQEVIGKIQTHCKDSRSSTVCKWVYWPRIVAALTTLANTLKSTPTTIASIEPSAGKLNTMLEELKGQQGSGDPQLDIMLSLAAGDVYEAFANFLKRTANANAEVATILQQKARESEESAKTSRAQCQKVVSSANLEGPITKYCVAGKLPSIAEALRGPALKSLRYLESDPRSKEIDELQRKIFVNRKDWKLYFDLAELYLTKQMWSHAAATSTYAISLFEANREEFSAILGCAALNMNFKTEAQFYLSKASELNGHKEQCLSMIRAQGRSK